MALNLTDHLDQGCVNYDQYSQQFSSVKLRLSPTVTIIIYIIYLLPFCFGVFGNVSVCLIFFQQKKLRSITNTFLMNLCKLKTNHWIFLFMNLFQGLNDLIVLCVSIPMTLSAALLEHWVFGAFLCKFVNFTPTLTALISTFTVAVIAVERWFFIVNKRKFHRRCTIITLILLWIVSILIALPEFISRHLEEFAPPSSISYSMNTTLMKPPCHVKKIYFCVLNPGLRMRIFSYIVITVQYLVPFLFVSISCYSISRFLKRRMKQMRTYQIHRPIKKSNSNEQKQQLQKSTSNLDEINESDYPSYDDLSLTITTNTTKSNPFVTRFRNTFQNSIVLDKQNDSSSSSIVDNVLMPTVKSQSHSERRFHRSRKLLICVAALFTISWLPLTVMQIYLEHNEEIARDEPYFVYAFLLIPCYLISSLSAWMNPVIYNYINRSFRREFYALYPCCFKVASSSSLSSPSIISRTEMPSMIGKRIQRQKTKEIEDNTNFLLPRTTNKSGARLVTFADGENKVKTSLVVINEHV
jgi:hypothetical protein